MSESVQTDNTATLLVIVKIFKNIELTISKIKLIKFMFSLVCNKIFWNISELFKLLWILMYTRNNFEYYFDLTRMINVHLEYFHIHLRHDVNSFDLRPARSFGLRSFRGVRSKKIQSLADDRIVSFSKIYFYQGFL